MGATALLYAWAVFGQRLLDLAPVARHEAVERLRDPLLVFDGAGRMVDHNRAACRILCPDEQHPSARTRADLARLVPEWAEAFEQTGPGENRTVHPAGHTYALSLTTLQATHEQELALCLLHDITGQARAEENLRLLNAGLEDRIAAEAPASLLVNAGEAIQECRERNQGQLEPGRVALALACAGGRVQITVSDNGGGLPVELGDRIFEPYVTTKLDRGGSGLGLYLARMLVETGFGGTLSLRPQASGACFVIELPASAAAERESEGLERSAPMPPAG